MLKRYVAVGILLFCLTSCQSKQVSSMALDEVDTSRLSYKVESVEDNFTRNQIVNLKEKDSTLSVKYKGFFRQETIQDLQDTQLDMIKDIETTLLQYDTFTSGNFSTEDVSDNGFRRKVTLEDESKILAYTYYTSGDFQVNYIAQWGSGFNSKVIDLPSVIADVHSYVGFSLTDSDIKNTMNEIKTLAKQGSYSIVNTNRDGSEGYFISVQDYGKETENWQLTCQRIYHSLGEDKKDLKEE